MIFLNTVKTVIFVIFMYLLFIFLNSTLYIYYGKADLFFLVVVTLVFSLT